jgi:hypothetical protein
MSETGAARRLRPQAWKRAFCPVSRQEAAVRIVGASSSVSTLTRRASDEACDVAPPEAQGTALIVIEAPRRSERSPPSTRHPSAPFVAHLIATRMQAPQTRARRRAEPEEAIAVYRSMTKPVSGRRVLGTRV